MGDFDLKDYVTVPERVRLFYEQYPDGRIVSDPPVVVTIGDRAFLSVTSRAYAHPNDPVPWQASAFEPYPGRTPFTRDSEAMNAETSAVGRAIAAAGIAVSRSMASANEVLARRTTGIPKPEAKGKVLAAAHGDQHAARTAWTLVLPDDPDHVDPARLEAAENVAAHLEPAPVREEVRRG